MYTVWVKIDETLPWIELKGKFETKRDARKAAKENMNRVAIRIVEMPEKMRSRERRKS